MAVAALLGFVLASRQLHFILEGRGEHVTAGASCSASESSARATRSAQRSQEVESSLKREECGEET